MNDPKLPQIINHQYGNYGIQTTLRHCQGEQHVALVEAMRPHTAILEEQELQIWLLLTCDFCQMYSQGQPESYR
ncbi:unnamed protein product [Urochloa humidicola]